MKNFLKPAAALLTLALVACGGGGGGGDANPPAAGGGTATPATFDTLVPDANMNWQTGRTSALSITVQNASGAPASNAAVRIFTMTMVNPEDGTPLEEPIPVELLETTMADATGRAAFEVRAADRHTELLVVATWEDQRASQRLALGSGVSTAAVTTGP